MRIKYSVLALMVMLLSQVTLAQNAPTLKPYTARYHVTYRGMSGGEIEFSLKSQGADRYVFSSHLLPNFFGSMFASDQAEDSSQLTFDSNGLRPQQFHSEDGRTKTNRDVRYDFDWSSRRVKGRFRDQDFTLDLVDGVQDRLSIQLAASLALQAGREPGKLTMIERNELQEFTIVKQGTEKVRTAAGEFDTVVLKSERTGSTRSTRYWYAAKLGYIPVRAERTSKGKVDIVMELKSVQLGE